VTSRSYILLPVKPALMDVTAASPAVDCYLAHGLAISSNIDFPELAHTAGPPDVVIRYGNVPAAAGIQDVTDCVCYLAKNTEMCFLWPNIARFRINSGNEIVIEPIGEPDEHIIRLFILGLGLAAILFQRGCLVLHASAVLVAGKGVLFVGPSGAGKSTTAAAFRAAGYSVLCDDVVGIVEHEENIFSFSAGVSHLRLWPDSVAGIVDEPDGLTLLHPLSKRSGWASMDSLPNHPIPLHRIYSLAFCAEDAVNITRISGPHAFLELVKHSHIVRCLADAGEAPNHFRASTRVARHVPISSLKRPRSFDHIPDLIRSVIEDCE